jgi:hypothetical protein
VDGDDSVGQRGGEDRVEDRALAVLDRLSGGVLVLHPGDPLADMLWHDVSHLHRPEERQQVVTDMAGVVRANAGFEQVMRQPFFQGVSLEGLPAAAGVAWFAGPDLSLLILPGLV